MKFKKNYSYAVCKNTKEAIQCGHNLGKGRKGNERQI